MVANTNHDVPLQRDQSLSMRAHSGQKVEQSNIKFEVEIVRIKVQAVQLLLNRGRIHTNRS